ncbi:MAG: efflux RND transporter periplasmic adaptor subunit [Rhodoferax sp.]
MNFTKTTIALSALAVTLGLAACSDKKTSESVASTPASGAPPAAPAASVPASAASAPAGPPVTVSTVKAETKDLAVNLRASGTVFPLASVDVKAQINSVVTKLHIRDGQFVRAGDPLLTLDARGDEANLAKVRAQYAKDQALLSDTQRQLKRAQELLAQNFVAKSAVDTAQAAVDSAAATLLADQAAIDAAKVALSYNHINAPLSGRAGAINVSTGTAVQANVTPTVTITQTDPIAVSFNLPQRNLPDAIAALKEGGAKVTATLADGGGSFQGRLYFVDNAVDPASGTVRARALFDNKKGCLWPGAFVEISQTINTLKKAVVVPQVALIQSARGTIVYVVEDGKAVLRPVKQVGGQSGEAAITGIVAGDVVVVEGKQNLRPGSLVVERAKEPKAGASGPAAGASGVASAAPASTASRTAP